MKKSTHSWPTLNELLKWFDTPLGHRLLSLSQQQCDQYLTKVFGYYAVSLGPLGPLQLEQCTIRNKFEVSAEFSSKSRSSLIADFTDLPFQDQSLDLIVLPYTLNFAAQPELILEEASRCLIGEGSLFILGFNSRSLFGLWRWMQKNMHDKPLQFPWRGEFYSLSETSDWLQENGFVIEESHAFYFRPPLVFSEALKRLKFLEVLGPLLWSQLGACYAILARKKVACMTPIKSYKKIESPIKEFIPAAHREKI
jgi:hypothetical protein